MSFWVPRFPVIVGISEFMSIRIYLKLKFPRPPSVRPDHHILHLFINSQQNNSKKFHKISFIYLNLPIKRPNNVSGMSHGKSFVKKIDEPSWKMSHKKFWWLEFFLLEPHDKMIFQIWNFTSNQLDFFFGKLHDKIAHLLK